MDTLPTMSEALIAAAAPVCESDEYTFSINEQDKACTCVINSSSVSVVAGDSLVRFVLVEDIVGFTVHSESLEIHAYPEATAGCCTPEVAGRRRPRQYSPLTLHASEAAMLPAAAQALQAQLQRAGCPFDMQSQRKWLLVVSNASGKGQAGRLTAQHWAPMMRQAGVQVQVLETEDPQHSMRIAQELTVGQFDAVVCAGGDGLLYEVLNGMMGRRDWDALLGGTQLGVLPGGSGNGVATSLCHLANETCCPASACYLLLRHRAAPVDVASVMYSLPPTAASASDYGTATEGAAKEHTLSHTPAKCAPATFGRVYSLMGVMHGVVGDLDIESEGLRCLGAERFTAQAIVRALWHRQYSSKVWYLPMDVAAAGGDDTGAATHEPAAAAADGDALDVAVGDDSSVADSSDKNESSYGNNECGPKLKYGTPAEALSAGWQQLDIPGDELFFFSAAKCPYISGDNCVSRESTMSDGCWHLQVLPAANFCSALSFLLSLDAVGSHCDIEGLQTVKAKAFRLDTGAFKQYCCCTACCACCASPGAAQQGDRWVTVDGNVVPDTVLHGEVHPSIVSLLGYVSRDECKGIA